MENTVKFTEYEENIRKKWLFWSVKLPASIFAILLFIGTLADYTFLFNLNFVFVCLLIAGSYYLAYYCAYKKSGTIFLLLAMVSLCIALASVIFEGISVVLTNGFRPGLGVNILITAYNTYLLYLSYKLRKINKNMQEKLLLASPDYVEAESIFSSAANLEELDNQLSKLRDSKEPGNGLIALLKAYDLRKKVLLKQS